MAALPYFPGSLPTSPVVYSSTSSSQILLCPWVRLETEITVPKSLWKKGHLYLRLSYQISIHLVVLDPRLQPTCSRVFGFPAASCGFCILLQTGMPLPREVFTCFGVLTTPAFSSHNFWWKQNQACGERRGQGIGKAVLLEQTVSEGKSQVGLGLYEQEKYMLPFS